MQKKYRRFLTILTFILVISSTIAYSALTSTLQIDAEARLRTVSDIRVSGISLSSTNGGTLQYESVYDVDTITSGFVLPTTNSSITYKVTVTNNGTIDQTIYDILTQSSNNSGLYYEISGYNVRDVIGFKTVVEFYITYKTTTPSEEPINVVNKFNFKKVYHVTFETKGGSTIPEAIKYEGVDLSLTGHTPTKPGYVLAGWTDEQDGTTVKYQTNGTYTLDRDLILYALYTEATNTPYKVNHYVHDLGTNTYTLNSTDNLTGKTNSSVTLSTKKKTIPGFTYVDGYLTGGTTKPESGAVTTTTILADGSRVINLYYRRNYLYIQYHVNGGSLATTHGTGYSSNGTLVTYTGNTTSTNFLRGVYGGKVGGINTNTYANNGTGLHNYDSTTGINITKSGYSAKTNAQWNTSSDGTGTSYDQAVSTYDADGFAGADLSTGDQIVTLYVNWVPVDYEITYDLQGGTLSTANPATYNIETDTFTLNNPTQVGYTFRGWTGSNGTTPQTVVTITKGSYGDKAYIANWQANTYTVKYNGNGNTSGSTENSTHTYDVAKNLTTNGFTKTGYTFTGWSTSSNDKNIVYDNTEYHKDSTSITSSYQELKQYSVAAPFTTGEVYQLEFDAKGTGNLTTYFYGASNYLQVVTVTNSDGWNGTGKDGVNHVVLTSSYKHYSVRFTLGSTGDGNVVKYVLLRAIKGNDCYAKNIRFYKVSSTSTTYTDEQSVKNLTATDGATVNLYAIWTPNTYTVTFDKNATSATGTMNNQTFTYDVAQNLSKNLYSRAGYTFDGWNVLYSNSKEVTNTAGYRPEFVQYTDLAPYIDKFGLNVTYRLELDIKSANTTNSSSINIYCQNGNNCRYSWGKSVTVSSTEWTHVVYEFTPTTRNDNVAAATLAFYGTYGTGNAPMVKNVRFSLKNTYADQESVSNLTDVQNGNVTLYAGWRPIVYQITYNLNGGSVSTANPTTYDVQTAAFTLNNPSKTGYNFSGWTGSNGTTAQTTITIPKGSTGDRTYTANYQAKTYEITLNKNGATNTPTATLTATYDSSTLTPTTITLPTRSYTVSGFGLDESRKSDGATVTGSTSLTSTYTFDGWTTSQNSGSVVISKAATPALVANISGYTGANGKWIRDNIATVYAKWLTTSGSTSATVKLPKIEKPGYTCGWTESSTGTTITYASEENITPTANKTLYGVCVANTYTVTANSNGGSIASTTGWSGTGNTATKSVTYDNAYGTLPTVSRTSYTFKGWSLLPEGYTQVEYIQSSGTQYIDTNYKPKSNTSIQTKFQFTSVSTKQQRVFGISSNSSISGALAYDFYINGSGVLAYAYNNNVGNWVPTGVTADTDVHDLLFDGNNRKLTLDTTSANLSSTVSNSSSLTLPIFARREISNGSLAGYSYMKLYSMKIYEEESLVRDFIPCINNTTGKAGLYDLVEGKFYGNSGTGDFTTGDEEFITSETIVKETSDHNIYAHWTLNAPATPTISGGTTKIYGASATTLTCSSSTTYGTGINKYYSFGYATSDGGTPTNWTTPTTSVTYSVPENAYAGQRWYSCRVYASDGTLTSTTSTSATTEDTELKLKNAKLTFDKNTGTSGGGTVYTRTNETKVFNAELGSTEATLPTASKTGYALDGWYTATTGGSKVLNANGSFTGTAVTNYTGTNKWAVTADKTLYARWNGISYTIEYYQGTTKLGSSTHTYDVAKNLTTKETLGGTEPQGWAFSGWSTSDSSTSIIYTDGQSVSNLTSTNNATIKLYAVFERTVRFNSGAASVTDRTQYYNPTATTNITAVSTPAPTVPVANKGWSAIGYRADKTAADKTYAVTTAAANITPAYNVYDSTTATSTTLNLYAVYSRTITLYHGKAKASGAVTRTQYCNISGNTVSAISAPAPQTTNLSGWSARGYRADTTAADRSYAVTTAAANISPAYNVANTLYAVYSRSVTMAYDANCTGYSGTTASHNLTQYYNTNDSVSTVTFTTSANGFTCPGRTFSSWGTTAAGGTLVAEGSTTTFAPAVGATGTSLTKTMYAQWGGNNYALTLDKNNATNTPTTSATVKYGTNTLTISGTYTKPARTYTVSGFGLDSSRKSNGATVSSTDDLVSTYTFDGFSTAQNGGSVVVSNAATPALVASVSGYTDASGNWAKVGDTTVYAKWSDGSIALPTITKTGYTCGWTESSSGTTITYASGESITPTANKTLYGVCTPNVYKITLNNHGATTAGTIEVYYEYQTTRTINNTLCYYYTDRELTTCLSSGYIIVKPVKTNYVYGGYYTSEDGVGTNYINVAGTFVNNIYQTVGDKTLHAKWTISNPATPTITGGATKVYGSSATTLTCSTSTTYGTGINKYYSFGYATSDGGTPTNWSTPTTSNTYSIAANTYVGQRWYSCRVYASDGTAAHNSGTVASLTTADTEVKYKNAKLTFNINDGISGGGTVYTRTGQNKVFTGELNSTEASIPSAYKTGYTLDGWYTAATGGTKVLNANGTFTGTAVSGYTSSDKWAATTDQTLYAQFSASTYTVTANSNNGTIASTTGWTGTGNTATKSVTYDNTYGTLPSVSRSNYELKGWSLLPEGYTQVEYIQFNGSQYINTDLKTKQSLRIITELSTTTASRCVFGARTSASASSLVFGYFANKTSFVGFGGTTANYSTTMNVMDGTKHKVFLSSDAYQIDGVNQTISNRGTLSNFYDIYIGTWNNAGSADSRMFDGKIYNFIVYDGDDLVRYMIPCINNTTGKAGLYDLVDGTFYGSATSSDFTTGSEEYITSDTVVTQTTNHNIYAKWNPVTYNITYDLNSGTNNANNPSTYNIESSAITLAVPTRSGYTFNGWSSNNLFDKNATPSDAGKYVTNAGTLVSNAEFSTYRVDVTPNTSYTIVNSGGSTAPGYAIYNSSGTKLAAAGYANTKIITFTTPANASYIKFSVVTQATSSRYDKHIFELYETDDLTSTYSTYVTKTIPTGSTGDKTFKANWSKAISALTITLSQNSYEYNGSAKTPTVTVKDGSTTLTKDTDYKVTYSNNTNAGTATVTITAIGAYNTTTKATYTGTTSKTFTITRKAVAFPTCSDVAYTAESQTLFAAHTSGQYTNTAITGTNVGSYTGDLTPTANYQWSSGSDVTSERTLTCKIVKSNTTTQLGAQNFTYNGNNQSATGASAKLANGTTITAPTFTYTYYNGDSCSGTALTAAPKDAGTYSVKASLAGTLNYNTSTSDCAVYTMDKKKAPALTLSDTTLTYNGASQYVNETGATTGLSVKYAYRTWTSAGTGSWSAWGTTDGYHSAKDVSKLEIKAIVVGNSNYYDSDESNVAILEIQPKSVAVTWDTTQTSFDYTGSGQAPALTTPVNGVTVGSTTEKINLTHGTKTDVGTNYTVTATCSSVTGGQAKCSNYTLTNTTSHKFAITAIPATCPTLASYTGINNGSGHSITVTGSAVGGTLKYSTDGSTWSTTNPSITALGTTTVSVKVDPDSNHNEVQCYVSGTTKSTVNLYNARIDFNLQEGTKSAGNNPIYVPNNATNVYTGRTNTTAGAIPTVAREGCTLDGWYTAANGGTKVVNSDRTVVASVSGWTDASKKWLRTSTLNTANTNPLYAHWSKAVSSLTITLGTTNYTYDGTAKEPTVTVKDGDTTLTKGTDYEIAYSNNINQGTATVTITGKNAYNSTTKAYYTGTTDKSYTIGKRTVTVTAPKANTDTLTYNGSSKTIAGTAGSCSTGGVMYYYTKNYTTTTAPAFSSTSSDWSTTYPSTAAATNAGTYHMWYYCYVSDTNNNTGTNINTAIDVTKVIERQVVAEPGCTAETYDGTLKTLLVAHTSGGYTNTAITGTTAGDYSTTLTLNSNYKWSAGSNVTSNRTKTCTIGKKSITITAKDQTVNYGTAITKNTNQVTVATLATGDTLNSITLTQSTTNATTTGKITPSAAVIKNSSSTTVTDSYTISYVDGDLTINKVNATCPTLASYTGINNGSGHSITVTGSAVGGTLKYSTDGSTWSTTNPSITVLGTTTVSVKVDPDSNHNEVQCYVSGTTKATVNLYNARIDFNLQSGTKTAGNNPIYVPNNATNVYTGRTNTTAGAIPTVTRTGYTLNGWFTATTGGTKVVNSDRTVVASVSGWTDANKKWLRTSTSDVVNTNPLYAQWTANTYTIEYYQGTTKLGSSSHTYDVAKNLTAYSGTAPQGWVFSGWTGIDQTNSASVVYTDGQSVSNLTSTNNATIKLYAVFERTVRFNSGATSVTDRTQYYNPTATTNITAVSAPAPTVPVANKGWSAIGYRADKTAADKSYAVTTAAANITPAYNVYDSTTATSTTLNLYAVYSRTITLYHGKAKAVTATKTQYCNTVSNAVSAISAPAPSTTDLTGWTARGYRYDTTAADRSYAVTTADANISPAYNVANTLYAVYSRTVTMAYNANGGTGTTASHNSTQYYNSNDGVSTVTFKTSANSFTYTGHTFSAWANDSATGAQVEAGENAAGFAPAVGATGTALTKTMYAIWDANKYDVSFNVNGGTGGQSATVEATYGSAMPTISTTAPTYTRLISGFGLDSSRKSNGATVTMPTQNVTSDNKIKSERTFGGWYDTDAASGGTQYYTATGASARTWNKTADTTLYARWSGGSVTLPTITKTGYICGWTESSTGTTITYGSEESITPTAAKTLYGVCVANTYTVNYYQGSTLLGSSTHTYDVAKALTAKATLGGTVPSAWSSFAGWTAPGQTNGTTVAHTNSESVSNLTTVNNGTVNLYAVFTRNVSFKSGQNGTATNVAQYYNPTATTNVSAVTAPKMTAISNWTALGYRNDTTASTATVSASTTATGTVTPAYNQTTLSYNGVYSRSYTATFYSGVNKATTNKTKASTTAYYNSSSTNLPTTVSIVTMTATDSTDIASWTERGWRDDTTVGDKEYAYGATATVAFGTNFYSVYIRDLTMEYNSNGGTGTTDSHTLPQYYNTNGSVSTVTFTTSANGFTRDGYTFNKWGTTAAGGTLVAAGGTTTFAPAQSATGTSLTKTMYAQWTGNSYTITLDKNGATNTPTSSMTATYGTTNLAYTGTYTKPVKSYTVSGFTTNPDSTYDETRHSNGSTVSSTDDITSTATFNGWYTSSSDGTKVISSADTPSLQVSVSGYTDSSGNWSKDDNVTLYAQFDTQPAVELPTITKQGYTCGWTTSSTGTTITYASGATITPTSDLTLYGVCVQKKYTLVIDKRGGTYNGSTAPLTYENVAYNSPEFLKIITNRGTQGTPSKAGYDFSNWYYFQNAIQKPRDVSTDVNFSSGTAGLTRYDNNSTNSITISRISNGSYGSGSSSANPVGDWVMAISKSSAASTTPGMGGFYQIHSSAANKTYVHVFLASVGRGHYLQIANNGTATKEWLTPNEGTGGWQVYAYKIAFTSNPGTFGYIYYSTSPNGVGTAATAFSSKLGYSAVLDVTSDSSTSSPYGTPYLSGSAVIAAAFVPKINTITLSSSSSGVTVSNAGTTTIYERFDDAYYKGYSTSSGLSNKLTSTSGNAIVVPTSSTHNFQGYYTGTNGTGTKIIGSDGKATANANTGNQFPNNGTLYASWTKKAQTTYSCRRRTVSYICSQQSCTPGYFFWSYASQCGQLPGYSYDGSGGPSGGYCTCTNPTCTAYNTSYGSWSGYSTYSSYPYTAGYEYQCTTT